MSWSMPYIFAHAALAQETSQLGEVAATRTQLEGQHIHTHHCNGSHIDLRAIYTHHKRTNTAKARSQSVHSRECASAALGGV